jgi:DNA-binding transcriptional LysR family regulator
MLDPYKLRLFMSVAQCGGMSKAAETYFMSQSAMSQHIAQLEVYVGQPLFTRDRHGVKLTRDGERLYDYAQKILTLIGEAELAVVRINADSEAELAIGATPGISTYRLPVWTQPFTSAYPRLKVRLQTDTTPNLVHIVLVGRLDMALVEGEIHPDMHARLNILPLEAIPHVVVVGKSHAWWGRDSLSLGDIQNSKLIMRPQNSQSRQWLDGILKAHKIKPAVSLDVDNIESIKRMVIQTDNIAILPDYAVESEIADGELWAVGVNDVSLMRDHKLIWSGSRLPTPVADLFMKHLNTLFHRIGN